MVCGPPPPAYPHTHTHTRPHTYPQTGLLIYGPDGEPWYSRALEPAAALRALRFATKHALTVTVYSNGESRARTLTLVIQ